MNRISPFFPEEKNFIEQENLRNKILRNRVIQKMKYVSSERH